MKDIVLAIMTLLKSNSAIAAKVQTRVYRDQLPPDYTYPAIVVTRTDRIRTSGKSEDRKAEARIQCTAFSKPTVKTSGEAEQISNLMMFLEDDIGNQYVTLPTGDNVYVIEIEDGGAVSDNSDALQYGEYRDNHDFKVKFIDE